MGRGRGGRNIYLQSVKQTVGKGHISQSTLVNLSINAKFELLFFFTKKKKNYVRVEYTIWLAERWQK